MALLFNSARNFFLVAGLVALCFQCAFAHTYLSSVYLNNQLLNEGDCVRPHPRTAFDSPIPLVTSPDMTCGWLPDANRAANRKCPIAAGSTIGIQWHHNSNSPSDDIIDRTHVGPIMFYLAKSDSGAGNVWFKIYEDGYSNGKWAVDRLVENRGRVDFTIPADIAPGNYLLRGELIALHGAYALNGVQPYVGCVELTISGSGNANPSGVAIPGYYKNTDPGMLMSVYQPFTKYIIPGPAVYVPGTSSTGTPSTPAPTNTPTSTPTGVPSVGPTNKPTPTNPPSPGNIKVGLNGGSSEWWVGVLISGGSETTVKVELKDSGSNNNWETLVDMSYAYVFSAHIPVQLPISLRLTSSTGKQVVLDNVFTSFSTGANLIDSGKAYTPSSTQAPTPTATPTKPATPAPTQPATPAPTKPATPAPTQPATPAPTQPATPAPTKAPTNPPSGSGSKVTIYGSASEWWFALTVSSSASKVELKDSGARTSYVAMTKNVWGPQEVYTLDGQGVALVAPLTIRITSASGSVETVSVSRISPNAVFEASS